MKKNIGVVTSTYPNYSGKEAIEGISKTGFKYIELASAPAFFEHMPRPEIRVNKKIVEGVLKECKDFGLTLQCIAGHTRLMKENGVENFKKVLDFASLGKIKYVTTDTGEVKNKEDEKRFYSDIRIIGDYAKEKGIVVCLEMHGNWCNTGKIGAEIIKTINHPNIKLNYDTGNVIMFGNTRPEVDLPFALPYMGYIHLKDHGSGKYKEWNFPALGEGITDFKKIFEMLKEFDGPGSVEIEFEGKEHSIEEINNAVKKSYTFLKRYDIVE
ncbi:MAG: sugar phosphate isomerase/epimerase [Actinomycetota bacterium]|nr:sugar phosphate isomerase/epimerase [Actinomycetota bacterium]